MDDFYLLLDVPRDADPEQVRHAYRVLAMQCHPDVAGAEREADFLRLKEAYETLSDSDRRTVYDRALRRRAEEKRPAISSGWRPPRWPSYPAPPHLFGSFATHRPPVEELAAVLLRNFTGRGTPKSQPVRDVGLELILTPEEAARGGAFALEIPAPEVCAVCEGTGGTGYFACDACGGEGSGWASHRIDVLIPRHAGDGTIIPVSLHPLGVRNLRLNVRVRIAET